MSQLGPFLGMTSLLFTAFDLYSTMAECYHLRDQFKQAKDEEAGNVAAAVQLVQIEQRNTRNAVFQRIRELEAEVEESERVIRSKSQVHRQELFKHHQNCLLLEDDNAKLGRKWRQAQNERNMSADSFRKLQDQYYRLRDNFDREVTKASHSLQDELKVSKQREASLQKQVDDVTAEKDRYWKAGCELDAQYRAEYQRNLDQAATARQTAQNELDAKDAVADGLRDQIQQLSNSSGINAFKQRLAAAAQQKQKNIVRQAQGHVDTANNEKQALRTERDQALQAKGTAESQTATLNGQLKTAKDQKSQAERSLRSELAACQGLRKDKTSLEAKVQQLDKDVKTEQGNVSTLAKERDSLKAERDSLSNERDTIKAERDSLAKQRKTLEADKTALDQKLEDANNKSLEEIIRGCQAVLAKQTVINGKDREIADLKARIAQFEAPDEFLQKFADCGVSSSKAPPEPLTKGAGVSKKKKQAKPPAPNFPKDWTP